MFTLGRRLRALFISRRLEREMADEMRVHLEQAAERLVARGMTPAEAARAARREFGNVGVIQEEGRDARGVRFIHDLLADVRYGARQIGRAPAFTAVAVLVLAVGIGVNSAAFTVFRGFFDRTPPGVHDPNGLVFLSVVADHGTSYDQGMSYPDFLDYRALSNVFSDVAVWTAREQVAVDGGSHPDNVLATFVSSGYFPLLHVKMALGHGFPTIDDRAPPLQPDVVVSYPLWQEQLGGDRGAIGRRITVNHVPVTVVGVAPKEFNGTRGARTQSDLGVWLPVSLLPAVVPKSGPLTARESLIMRAFGRLRSGVDQAKATAAASAVAVHIADTYPLPNPRSRIASTLSATRARAVRLDPPSGMAVGPGRVMAQVELGVVVGIVSTMILLIACANVSNLLLARAVSRRREIAVRISLGAGRGRIVRQLLTESLILALAAGAAGIVLQLWVVRVGGAVHLLGSPSSFAVDWDTLWFAAAFAVATTLFFGLAPALHAVRGDVSRALKGGSTGLDQRQLSQQAKSVMVQVALSLVFVCVSGVFIGLAYGVQHLSLGFDSSDHVLVAKLDLGNGRYSGQGTTALIDAAEARLAALPGVSNVSATNAVPFALEQHGVLRMSHDDGSPILDANDLNAYRISIDSSYFATIGTPVLAGRGIGRMDRLGAPSVAVIDATTARLLWPGKSPIGQIVRIMRETEPLTVVGVVGDVRVELEPGSQTSLVYVSRRQFPDSTHMALLITAPGNAATFAPAVRQAMEELDPHVIMQDVQTLGTYRELAYGRFISAAELLSALGAIALALAAIGLYAAVAFNVSQRSRDIGIRMALGARRQDVVALFLGHGAHVMLMGLAVGLPLTVVALGFLMKLATAPFGPAFAGQVLLHSGLAKARALTYGEFMDLRFVVAALLTFPVGAALAIWIPARRAATVDPVVALRSE